MVDSTKVMAECSASKSKPIWNSLEIAKIIAPIASALILAFVGLYISMDLEQQKIRIATTERAVNSTPHLLRSISRSNGSEFDARPLHERSGSQPYLRVIVSNGTVVEGWPLIFDYPPTGYEVFLSPACTYADGNLKRVLGPGILLLQSSIQQIEFIENIHSLCAQSWYATKNDIEMQLDFASRQILFAEDALQASLRSERTPSIETFRQLSKSAESLREAALRLRDAAEISQQNNGP